MSDSIENQEASGGAEKVGYGQPPVATRFRKGQSGNPSGRPRKSPSIAAMIEAELDRMVPVKVGNESVMITRREIVAKKIVDKMAFGQMSAIEWFVGVSVKHPDMLMMPDDVIEDGGDDMGRERSA